jgi:hypothetical protein
MQSLAAMDREKRLSYIAAAITGYLILQVILGLIDKQYLYSLTCLIGVAGSIGWIYAEYKLIWRV